MNAVLVSAARSAVPDVLDAEIRSLAHVLLEPARWRRVESNDDTVAVNERPVLLLRERVRAPHHSTLREGVVVPELGELGWGGAGRKSRSVGSRPAMGWRSV